jgi:hypothetical protein
MRNEYLNNKIWKNDAICVNILRLKNHLSFNFVNLLGIVAYCKIPYICVLSSKLQCF